MGYYSTITRIDSVWSKLPPDDFRKAWEKAIEKTQETDLEGYLNFYNFDISIPMEKDGNLYYQYDLHMDDLTAKHYADRLLAEFIAGVIAQGEHCIIEFAGEDGTHWGYYITIGSVREIEYKKMVDGKPIE